MSAKDFVEFVTSKLGITKNNPTIKEFFGDALGLKNVFDNKGIGVYAENTVGSGKGPTLMTYKKANEETVDVKQILESYYDKNFGDEGIVDLKLISGKSQDSIINIAKAFSAKKIGRAHV